MNDPLLDALSAELGALLCARGWRITAAESCTGGLVAASITATAGSSAWFDEAFVTYSNEAKTRLLGVPADLIEAHGAVSEPVARAMAQGALRSAGADLSVAITGIAGPGGATPGKPVGIVCFAWAQPSGTVRAVTRHFDGDRATVRRAATIAAIEESIAIARG